MSLPVDDDDIDIPVTITSPPSSSRPIKLAPSANNTNISQVTEKHTRSGRINKPPSRTNFDLLLFDCMIIDFLILFVCYPSCKGVVTY